MNIPTEYKFPPVVESLMTRLRAHIAKGVYLIEEGKFDKGRSEFLEAKKISVELELLHGITMTYRGDI